MAQTADDSPELPADLRGWNWGAFLLTWIWGLGNRTPIALLALIPGVNFVMMVVLGLKGNVWAWRNDTWKSVEHFRTTQRYWAIGGVAVWVTLAVILGGSFWGIQTIMKNNGAYTLAMQELRTSREIAEVFGQPLEDGFFPTGSVSTSGSSGIADLTIFISGPRAKGTAYVKAVKEYGEWQIGDLTVRTDGIDGRLIRVLP